MYILSLRMCMQNLINFHPWLQNIKEKTQNISDWPKDRQTDGWTIWKQYTPLPRNSVLQSVGGGYYKYLFCICYDETRYKWLILDMDIPISKQQFVTSDRGGGIISTFSASVIMRPDINDSFLIWTSPSIQQFVTSDLDPTVTFPSKTLLIILADDSTPAIFYK